MRGGNTVRRSTTTISAIALVFPACVACSSADTQPTVGRCQAILSVGNETYWGVQIGTERIHLGEPLRRGVLSACTDGTFAHHATGRVTTVYRLNGFDTDTALVSHSGPGDPFTLWVRTTGFEPPFVVPAELQQVIDDNPVDDGKATGVN